MHICMGLALGLLLERPKANFQSPQFSERAEFKTMIGCSAATFYVSVFFQLGKECPFVQQIYRHDLRGKASTCHIKPKFRHINERLNIQCFFPDSKSSF